MIDSKNNREDNVVHAEKDKIYLDFKTLKRLQMYSNIDVVFWSCDT